MNAPLRGLRAEAARVGNEEMVADFLAAVSKMRRLQRAFFAGDKRPETLPSKAAERRVDQLLLQWGTNSDTGEKAEDAPDGWISREGDPPCARCWHDAASHDPRPDDCPIPRTCPRYRGHVAVVRRWSPPRERGGVVIDLIVTRHRGLVEYAREIGVVPEDVEVVSHIERPEILDGRHVLGVLPLHLAARCASITEIPLDMAPDDRGLELSLERMREIAQPPEKFVVQTAARALAAAYREDGGAE